MNTLGAVLGAALTGFVFLRFLGMTQTLWLAVGLNLIVALVAGIAAALDHPEAQATTADDSVLSTQNSALSTPRWGFGLVALACAAATGATTLGLEVVWARILGIFSRLVARDAKPRYRAFMPRLWTYMDRCLAGPAPAGLAAWFASFVPLEARA